MAEVEERLDLIGQLRRKYGGVVGGAAGGATRAAEGFATGGAEGFATGGAEGFATGGAAEGAVLSDSIHEILNYAARAGERLKLLDGEAECRPQMKKELAEIDEEMLMLASRMSERRREAASRLEVEAGRHLRELAFQDCGFEVRLKPVGGEAGREASPGDIRDAAALTRTGADIAEFFVRLNPGMPAAPLRETASGGEMSRIMLAVKSAVSASRETATLVFDEIDAGIGGETGAAVGAKLKSLAGGSQIICITHLPQIACCADAHFRVVKRSDDGRTVTTVERLEGDSVIDELCRMMGSRPEDANARAHARELLQRAKSKSGKSGKSAAGPNKSFKISTRAGSR